MGFGDGRGLGISQTDALYASLANPNSLAGSLSFAIQSFTLNGGAQTISATGGANVVIQGSTVSSTIKLPASPSSGQMLELLNAATVNLTLDGNGNNIDGAATVTMSAGYGRTIVYTGANGWRSSCLTRSQADTLYGQLGTANTWTGTTNKFSNGFGWGVQTFATSAAWSGTVSDTSGGTIVNFTGTGTGGTLSLPPAPVTGYVVALQIPGAILPLTLNAGGSTQIGTSTSIFLSSGGSAAQSMWLYFDGTAYQQLGVGSVIASQFSLAMNFNQRTSFYGPVSYRVQSFSGAGTISTTSGSGGSTINKSGAGAYTLALPTSPLAGDTWVFVDGQGDALTSNLSVSSSDKAINATAAGGGSVAVLNTNYGRGTATYNGTKWIVKPG